MLTHPKARAMLNLKGGDSSTFGVSITLIRELTNPDSKLQLLLLLVTSWRE